MKHKLLAAVATFAFVATGVAAQAQDNPKGKERPAAAEKMEQKAPEAPKAAQMERQEPKGQEQHMKGQASAPGEAPKAAQTERKEAPKAAQTERKEAPKAAETERKEGPKAAQGQQQKEAPRAAQEQERKDMMKPGAQKSDNRNAEGAQQRPATQTGAKEGEKNAPRTAQEPNRVRVMGKVKISNEHAVRVGESLHRDARPVNAGIDIRVGVRVPETVEIRPLPEDVISIAPEYRGYNYFIDSDDEIVFVSPESHEIVGTIVYEGRAASDDVTHVRAARPCPTED